MKKRRQLHNDILASNRRLDQHRAALRKSCSDVKSGLQTQSPMLLLAGAVITGVVVHRLGWRSTYGLALFSYRHFVSKEAASSVSGTTE
jgi:hypothetical protein